MKTYTKQDFHNPEQLTRQQVGAEYRLLLPGEIGTLNDEVWCELFDVAWYSALGSCNDISYRIPLATPLPDGTVLSSNECCWSDQPRKKRVYCAGPMSSHPEDFNFPAFYAVAESLEKQGYEPVNPAQLDIEAGYTLDRIKQLDPVEFQEFLKGAAKRDLDALQQCDAIALMPGWENSKVARAELAVAEWLGLKTYTISPDNYGKWWLVIAEDVERINSKQENCEYCQGPCQSSTPSGCVGAEGVGVFGNLGPCSACIGYDGTDGESGPVDTLSEKAQQISDAKQPYNSDERAEWGVDAPTATSTPQYAPDDPKGAAGALKAQMWLLPPYALQQTAWVHKHGSEKYGPYNWRKTSVCATTYISAIMRHLDAWRDGENNDPESGVSHIAHIAASCNILLDAQHCGKLNDDRAKSCQI